jgi:hypothetical protein
MAIRRLEWLPGLQERASPDHPFDCSPSSVNHLMDEIKYIH